MALVDRRVGRSRLEAGKVSNVRGTKQRGGYEGGEGQWIPTKWQMVDSMTGLIPTYDTSGAEESREGTNGNLPNLLTYLDSNKVLPFFRPACLLRLTHIREPDPIRLHVL